MSIRWISFISPANIKRFICLTLWQREKKALEKVNFLEGHPRLWIKYLKWLPWIFTHSSLSSKNERNHNESGSPKIVCFKILSKVINVIEFLKNPYILRQLVSEYKGFKNVVIKNCIWKKIDLVGIHVFFSIRIEFLINWILLNTVNSNSFIQCNRIEYWSIISNLTELMKQSFHKSEKIFSSQEWRNDPQWKGNNISKKKKKLENPSGLADLILRNVN